MSLNVRARATHLARVEGHRGIPGALAGQEAELAKEPAGAMDGDDALLRRPVPLDRGHPAGQHDEETAVPVAPGEQDLPWLDGQALALRIQRGDLGVTQPRVRPGQAVGSSDEGFVDIAPAPVLTRLVRLDDRVPDREGVGTGVAER